MVKPPLQIQKKRPSLFATPILGMCLIVSLIIAERGGLPSDLFQQFFVGICFMIFLFLGLGTKTLNAKQFFRPANGGQTITRSFATCFFVSGGVIWFTVPLGAISDSPAILLMPLGFGIGAVLFSTFLEPKLISSETPDMVRLAVGDHIAPILRVLINLLALSALFLSLGSMLYLTNIFVQHQTLLPKWQASSGIIALAGLTTLLGGRAFIVRSAALVSFVFVFFFTLIAINATELIGQNATEMLANMDVKLQSMPKTDFEWVVVILTMFNVALLGLGFAGIAAGNMGGTKQYNTPSLNFLNMCSSLLLLIALMTIGLIATQLELTTFFIVSEVPSELNMPLALQIATVAIGFSALVAILSTCLFSIAFSTLRGLAPILSTRREPDAALLFRARFYILLLTLASAFYSSTFSVGEGWLGTNLLLIGVVTLFAGPAALVQPPEGGWKNRHILNQWIVGLIALAAVCGPTVFAGEQEQTLRELLSQPALSAAFPVGFLSSVILLHFYRMRSGSKIHARRHNSSEPYLGQSS